ncbi:transposase family protein [Streptomyces sp. uw30]|uniref:transposase family protein n=1 Tax=Streptomyces sp. uw30 TaxID=1828179 RepID=UPI0021C972D1|nr:transposase family protein [Streptomyces sp. uw30]
MHVLALTDERGRMIWISAARPGRTRDITAARRDRIRSHLRAAGLGALADLGFLGLDDDPDDPVVVAGFKATRARKLTTSEKEASRRSPPHAPRSSTASPISRTGGSSPSSAPIPPRATALLCALFVLTNLEGAR